MTAARRAAAWGWKSPTGRVNQDVLDRIKMIQPVTMSHPIPDKNTNDTEITNNEDDDNVRIVDLVRRVKRSGKEELKSKFIIVTDVIEKVHSNKARANDNIRPMSVTERQDELDKRFLIVTNVIENDQPHEPRARKVVPLAAPLGSLHENTNSTRVGLSNNDLRILRTVNVTRRDHGVVSSLTDGTKFKVYTNIIENILSETGAEELVPKSPRVNNSDNVSSGPLPLEPAEAYRHLTTLYPRRQRPWRLTDDGKGLERDFVFNGFKSAFDFMDMIAVVARKERHHPVWFNDYNRLRIRWTTHDSNGITRKDITMAKACDDIALQAKEREYKPGHPNPVLNVVLEKLGWGTKASSSSTDTPLKVQEELEKGRIHTSTDTPTTPTITYIPTTITTSTPTKQQQTINAPEI